MSGFTAVFDACALHPAPLRDLLVRLALTGLFRARWTEQIHQEWMRSLRERRSDLTEAQLARTRRLMDEAVPDCLVKGHEALIDSLELPDADDRHVLAAAIACQAGVVVTYNTKHFPTTVMAPLGIEVEHPDEFVVHLFDLAPAAVCAAVRDQRLALKKPERSVRELMDTFLSLELAGTVARLVEMQELL